MSRSANLGLERNPATPPTARDQTLQGRELRRLVYSIRFFRVLVVDAERLASVQYRCLAIHHAMNRPFVTTICMFDPFLNIENGGTLLT